MRSQTAEGHRKHEITVRSQSAEGHRQHEVTDRIRDRQQ